MILSEKCRIFFSKSSDPLKGRFLMIFAAKALIYETVNALRDEADSLLDQVPKTDWFFRIIHSWCLSCFSLTESVAILFVFSRVLPLILFDKQLQATMFFFFKQQLFFRVRFQYTTFYEQTTIFSKNEIVKLITNLFYKNLVIYV